jgi:RNA polymerase sigma-70 factor (ECF subfamily)
MVKRKIKKEDFEHIIDEYQDRMFSFAFFRTGSYESAQDLVQDLFVRLYENREQYEVDNLKAYLFKSLLNACMDYKRKESRTPRVPLDSLQDVPDVEETKCVQEYVRIETMLRDLPDEQAEVVKMKFVDDFSFVEIADLLNLSVNTVKSRYRYAVDNLRKEYKIECV